MTPSSLGTRWSLRWTGPRGLDATQLLHIRGEASSRCPPGCRSAVDVDRELLVQHDLELTGQLRSQDLRLLGGQASQVEIAGGPPVVVRAGRLAEPFHRSTRRAAVQVVDRDARRDHSRLATRLVLLCPDGLLRGGCPQAGLKAARAPARWRATGRVSSWRILL